MNTKGGTSLLVTSMPVAGSFDFTFNRSYGKINKFTSASHLSICVRPTFPEGELASTAGESVNMNTFNMKEKFHEETDLSMSSYKEWA